MGKVLDNRLSNINAFLSNNITSTTYQDNNYNLLQQKINAEWEYATDKFIIQEEIPRGSKQYQDVEIRIGHVVNKPSISSSGNSILGDDIRSIIFKNIDHLYGLGYMYQFDENFWITSFSDEYHYPTASATVRRCNNTLKWLDDNNVLQEEPCFIDYLVNRDKLKIENINLLEADIKVTCQNNVNTITIKNNQRFILDGQAFKVQRINSFLREKTMVSNSAPLISYGMFKDVISDDDDLINNIANTNRVKYNLTINQSNFNGLINDKGNLSATVTLNGTNVTKVLNWSSSDTNIVTIDSNGNYNLINDGIATITCCLSDNMLISDSITITVSNSNVSSADISISPNINTLYEGDSPTVYTVTNSIQSSDNFNFVDSGINNLNNMYYTFKVLSTNTFSVQCNQRCSNNLNIICTDVTNNSSETISISLKGGFYFN
ncbi:Ig-like domain-containing protein [Clostridium sp.]|uniref:Ig-like domain-containing protein n=1 Tax=Clostridium sp. TaxID=1506 RepID=UPI002639FB10|nr:Ig-like domain-containing protein [Clostridium sp.]